MWLAATNGFLLALKGRGDAPGFSSHCCDPWASRNQPPRPARSRPDLSVPRPPVLEHTTAELVSLIANLSEREDFTVDILGQTFALAQQRVGISVPGSTPTELPSTTSRGSCL